MKYENFLIVAGLVGMPSGFMNIAHEHSQGEYDFDLPEIALIFSFFGFATGSFIKSYKMFR